MAITLQSAVAPRLELFGVRPDWLLVVVIFFALHAKSADAVIGAWILGIGADLMTIERVGLMSLSYAFAAIAVMWVREYVFRYRALTQFAVTLAACFIIRFAWLGYCMARYPQAIGYRAVVEISAVSLYTAAFAPLFHRLLFGMSRQLGLPKRRYTHAGVFSLGGGRV